MSVHTALHSWVEQVPLYANYTEKYYLKDKSTGSHVAGESHIRDRAVSQAVQSNRLILV
jgi:hypothetical protein